MVIGGGGPRARTYNIPPVTAQGLAPSTVAVEHRTGCVVENSTAVSKANWRHVVEEPQQTRKDWWPASWAARPAKSVAEVAREKSATADRQYDQSRTRSAGASSTCGSESAGLELDLLLAQMSTRTRTVHCPTTRAKKDFPAHSARSAMTGER